ncbi:MAG: hypothetical protein EBZ05_08095, partial [Verrucomicrobia bacterium]|nr:hypothetical protein [Verrucomicrobiota bacterium]
MDSALTIVDQTSGTNTAAKVQISSGFQEGDTLALPSGSGYAGITGSYNATNGILTLSGSGNAAAYQAAIRAVTFSTTNTSTSARTIGITLGNAVAYNGHFYEVVTNSVTWPTARSGALAKSLFGIPGYLVNITSSGENQFILSKVSTTAWIGASDSGTEGTWKWMDGPEAGTTFWIGTGTGSAQGGQYSNWNTNEPNDAGGAEDYASIYSGVGVQDGKWNDYGGSGPYIVEYGNPNAVITFSGSKTLSVQQASQTITFNTLPSKTFGDAAFNLTATGGGSGNPVTYSSSNTNVATVSGSTLTVVGAGTTTITAEQAGNSNYSAATAVSRTLTVSQASQTITFNTLSAKTFGDAAFSLTATGGASGNAVTYSSSNTNVATVSGSTVTVVGVGTTTITANQAGNSNYSAATTVSRTLTVVQASQTITFGALSPVNIGVAPFVLSASGGGSGNAVTFVSSNPGVATVSGSMVTVVGVGATTITASQAGNGNYLAATDVSRTLTVNSVRQSVAGTTVTLDFSEGAVGNALSYANNWSTSDTAARPDGYAQDGTNLAGFLGGYNTAPSGASTQL